MIFQDVMKKISVLKISGKKFYSNIILNIPHDNAIKNLYQNENSIIFTVDMYECERAYFASVSLESLKELLQQLDGGTVVEILYKNENEFRDFFAKSNLLLHATYIRITARYHKNPFYDIQNENDKVLSELYDVTCGEYPNVEDAEDLNLLMRESFDVVGDRLFSLEQWRELIQNRQVLVYKEDGKIYSYYVWREEKEKLYCNGSLNLTTADILYNLERRVFDGMWDKGIRVFYAWFNLNNERILKRGRLQEEKCIEMSEHLYADYFVSQ